MPITVEPPLTDRAFAATGKVADAAALALTIFVVGWYWLPATAEQGSRPHDLLFLAVSPLLMVVAIRAPWRRLLGNPIVATGLAFIAYLTLSLVWSRQPLELDPGRVMLDGAATALFFLSSIMLLDGRRFGSFRIAIVVSAVTSTLVAAVRLVQGHGYPVDRLSSAIHFEHPNLFAHYIGFAAVLAAGAALRADRRWPRWFWIGSTAVLSSGVVLTRGRAATAALATVLLISVALHLGRRAAALVAIALVASTTLTIALMDDMITGFVARGDAGRDVIYSGLVDRLDGDWLWGAGLAADDDTVFEKGSEDFPRGKSIEHPHSALVGTLYYGGVIGCALLLVPMVLGFRRTVSEGRRETNWDLMLLLVFGSLCLLVDGQRLVSHPHLSSWLLLWLPLGLAAAFGGEGNASASSRSTVGPDDRSLTLVAPQMWVMMALLAVAALLRWPPSSITGMNIASWSLVVGAAAGLYLLLAELLGPAPARVASLMFLCNPLPSAPSPDSSLTMGALAVVLFGLWLILVHHRSRSPLQWLGITLVVLAGIPSPAVALSVAPPMLWWATRRWIPAAAPAIAFTIWVVACLLAGDGSLPGRELLTIAFWLSSFAAALVGYLGSAATVPSVIGVLMSTSSERRWLAWWLVGGVAGSVLLFASDRSGEAALLPLAAPLATAITYGVLWLGHELVRIDTLGQADSTGPLDGRRLSVAQWLTAALLLCVVATRLFWSTPLIAPTTGPEHTIEIHSPSESS